MVRTFLNNFWNVQGFSSFSQHYFVWCEMKPPDVLIFSLSFVIEMKQLHQLFCNEGRCRCGLTFAVLWSSLLLNIVGMVEGHAIFWEPPSRASLGKHNMNFCKVPINDDHMSLYCGGIKVSETWKYRVLHIKLCLFK